MGRIKHYLGKAIKSNKKYRKTSKKYEKF